MEDKSLGPKERIGKIDDGNLAPLEHLMLGSTPFVKGKRVDVKELIDQVKKDNRIAFRELMTPIFYQEGARNIENIRKERDQEKERKSRVGGVSFLDSRQQVDLSFQQGLHVWIEPSEITESGEVAGKWRIYLLDGDKNLVKDASLLKALRINERHTKRFRFEDFKEGEGYRLLVLNLR